MLRFRLKWLFILTTLAAIVVASLVKPKSLIAWAFVWTILGSFVYSAALTFSRHRTPFIATYALAGGFYMLFGGCSPFAIATAQVFGDVPRERWEATDYFSRLLVAHFFWCAAFGLICGWLASKAMRTEDDH